MSKTEGEYELVLGNRQLLSAFFIIVILFGVFFTMGYVVGRSSTPSSSPSSTVAANPRSEAPASSAPAQSAAPPPAPPKDEAKEAEPTETKPVETKPVETAPATRPEKAPAKAETPHRAPASRPAPSSGAAVAVNPGLGNMYLQVMAVGQPQANVVVDTLKQKGFPVVLAQSPNPSLFRVMVGPYTDAAGLGKAKAQLENAGFKPLVRK